MAVTTASVPRITCRCRGIKFDFLLSRIALPKVPSAIASARECLMPSSGNNGTNKVQCADVDSTTVKTAKRRCRSANCLLNGRLTIGMDEASVRSLGGPTVSILFRQLVPFVKSVSIDVVESALSQRI